MARPVLSALFLLPLALHAQPAATAWPAPSEPAVTPDSPPLPLCTTRGAERICRHVSDDGDLTFTIERDGQEVHRWNAGGWLHTDFRVFDADFDGDGSLERVVANLDGVSNGLGVHYWTLHVFTETPGGWSPTGTIPVSEFGPEGGSFATADGGPVLWATEWMPGPDPSGRRRDGLYFVGRPLRFERGAPVPAADLPVRARRFLYRFAEERATADPATPAAWLADRRAETRRTDPYLEGREMDSFRGTVQAVTPEPTEEGSTNWTLRIRPAQGAEATYTYPFGYSEAVARVFRHVGGAASGRLYPAGYLPADPVAWLIGRRVRVATYTDEAGEPRRVLWLE